MLTINRAQPPSAMLVALALTACAAVPGSNAPAPPANPIPSVAAEIPVFEGGVYQPGRYFIAGGGSAYDWFGLDVTARVPQGWIRGSPGAGDFGIAYLPDGADGGPPMMEMQFWLVDNVTAGGCATGWPHAGFDPPVGPGIDDLASALASLSSIEATTPEDITLSGWHGRRLDLTFPEGFCADQPELFAWSRMLDPSQTLGAGVPGTHQSVDPGCERHTLRDRCRV